MDSDILERRPHRSATPPSLVQGINLRQASTGGRPNSSADTDKNMDESGDVHDRTSAVTVPPGTPRGRPHQIHRRPTSSPTCSTAGCSTSLHRQKATVLKELQKAPLAARRPCSRETARLMVKLSELRTTDELVLALARQRLDQGNLRGADSAGNPVWHRSSPSTDTNDDPDWPYAHRCVQVRPISRRFWTTAPTLSISCSVGAFGSLLTAGRLVDVRVPCRFIRADHRPGHRRAELLQRWANSSTNGNAPGTPAPGGNADGTPRNREQRTSLEQSVGSVSAAWWHGSPEGNWEMAEQCNTSADWLQTRLNTLLEGQLNVD